jgi:preprotein translocase subunit SecG
VLLQQGKGAEMGAAFGGGASGTVFGSQGSTPFLVKLTAFLAAVFFVTSISFGYISGHQRTEANNVSAEIKAPAAPIRS